MHQAQLEPVLEVVKLAAKRANETLADVNLAVYPGDLVVVLGAGADLLVDVCARRPKSGPTSGTVRYRGEPVVERGRSSGRGRGRGREPDRGRGRGRPRVLPANVAIIDKIPGVLPARSGQDAIVETLALKGINVSPRHVSDMGDALELGDLLRASTYEIAGSELHLLDCMRAVLEAPSLILAVDPWPRRMRNETVREKWYETLAIAAKAGAGVLLRSATDDLDRLARVYPPANALMFHFGGYELVA